LARILNQCHKNTLTIIKNSLDPSEKIENLSKEIEIKEKEPNENYNLKNTETEVRNSRDDGGYPGWFPTAES
jgi:hypothetical protein